LAWGSLAALVLAGLVIAWWHLQVAGVEWPIQLSTSCRCSRPRLALARARPRARSHRSRRSRRTDWHDRVRQ
jgi:hypothetical protein